MDSENYIENEKDYIYIKERNMSDNQQSVFRKKTLERISSPEQLSDYLRVTNLGIWAVLAAVILLLIGIFAWSSVGTLETTADATVVVSGSSARVVTAGGETLSGGMILRVAGREYFIASADTDEYGRMTGSAAVDLPDGTYEGEVVVDSTRPIDFLLESR